MTAQCCQRIVSCSSGVFSKGQGIFPAGGGITAEGRGTFSAGHCSFTKGRSISAAGYGADFRCRAVSIINNFISAAPSRGVLTRGLVLVAKSCRPDCSCLGQIAKSRGILPGSDGINAKGRRIGLSSLSPLAKSCGPFFRCFGSLPESHGIVPAGHIVSCCCRSIRLLASKCQSIAAGSCAVLANDRGPYAVRFCTGTNGYGIFSFC